MNDRRSGVSAWTWLALVALSPIFVPLILAALGVRVEVLSTGPLLFFIMPLTVVVLLIVALGLVIRTLYLRRRRGR